MADAPSGWLRFYVPGCTVWRVRSGRDGRLKYLSRLPLVFRLVLLFFLPHTVMAVGVLVLGLVGLAALPFGGLKGMHPLLAVFLSLFGLVLSPVLLLMQFGHASVLIDRRRGQVREDMGLWFLPFVPMIPCRRKRHAFSSLRSVCLEPRVPNLPSSRLPCGVRLGLEGGAFIEVADCRDLAEGRRLAEEIAAFAGVPLVDSTGADAVRRKPSELDLPLVFRSPDRVRSPIQAEPPTQPVAGIKLEGGRAVAFLPAPPFKPGRWFRAFLLCLLLGVIGIGFRHPAPERPSTPLVLEASPQEAPPPSLWPWRLQVAIYLGVWGALVVGLAAGGISALVLVGKFLRRSPALLLESGPEGVGLTSRYLGLRRSRFVAAARLEELRVEGSDTRGWVLLVVSDDRVLKFGWGLRKFELDYVRALVWNTLIAPPSALS